MTPYTLGCQSSCPRINALRQPWPFIPRSKRTCNGRWSHAVRLFPESISLNRWVSRSVCPVAVGTSVAIAGSGFVCLDNLIGRYVALDKDLRKLMLRIVVWRTHANSDHPGAARHPSFACGEEGSKWLPACWACWACWPVRIVAIWMRYDEETEWQQRLRNTRRWKSRN